MRASDFIIEALTPAQTEKLWRDLGSEYDKNIHDNIFKGKSRIYIPLDATNEPMTQESPIQSAVKAAIQPIGYEINDYKAGIASKIGDPNRKIKVGKLIKDQNLLQKFANDPSRAATKQNNLEVVISRDPVDIAGMSTDRGWVSCMNLAGGVNKRYVPAEVKNGAIIAYLIKSTDREIDRPLARILMKPYIKDNHMILVADRVYGTAPASFVKLANKFTKWTNSGSPEGDYRLTSGSYADERDTNYYHVPSHDNIEKQSLKARKQVANDTDTSQEVLARLAGDNDTGVRLAVAKHASTSPEVLARLAGDNDTGVRLAVALNPSTPTEILRKLAGGTHEVRRAIAKNTSTPPDVLASLAKDTALGVRVAIARNTSTPPEALLKVARTDALEVRRSLAHNTSTPQEILLKLANGKEHGIKWLIARNTSASSEVLNKLADDKDPGIRLAVTQNTSTPPEVLIKLTKGDYYIIRQSAIQHLRAMDK